MNNLEKENQLTPDQERQVQELAEYMCDEALKQVVLKERRKPPRVADDDDEISLAA